MTIDDIVALGRAWKMGQQDDEIGPFFSYVLAAIRPKTVIELGLGQGGLARAWCEIATDRVIGVDMPDGDGGMPLEACEARNARLREASPKFIGILGDSQDAATTVQVQRLVTPREGVDVLFIDADHRGDMPRRDYARYGPLVRKGGLIVLHDINSQPHPGVQVFWNELQMRHAQSLAFSVQDVWGGIGVAIV